MRTKKFAYMVASCLLLSPLGCGDDGGGTASTGDDDTSGGTGSTVSASSDPSGGAGPGGESASVSTSADATSSSDSTTTSTSASGSADGSTGGDETGTDDTTTGGANAAYCGQSCEEDVDCCPLGSVLCPAEEYPDNWSCNEGICEFGGCESNEDCESLLATDECHPIEGVGTCFDPCVNDGDCTTGTCSGQADDGTSFCQVEPEPCENDSDCNGLGICDVDSGQCHCLSDANCTDATFDTCVME